MAIDDNPYRSGGGGYAPSVQFGDATPATAPAGLIKDTTTAAFSADVIQENRVASRFLWISGLRGAGPASS